LNMKCVEERDNSSDVLIGHCLIAGDREFLGVDLFSDGERKGVPFLVTFLFVGWNGIMDLCLDSVVCEILLKFVAMGT